MEKKIFKKFLFKGLLPLMLIGFNSCSQGPNLDDKLEAQKKELDHLEKALDSLRAELSEGKTSPKKYEISSEAMSSGYASIKNIDEDFYTTDSYRNGKPGNPKSEFRVGEKVYVWASVYAPRTESIEIRWVDSNGEVFENKSYHVATNTTDSGYRIYTWKSSFPGQTGNYSVQLFNSQGMRIAGSDFSVN